MKFLFVYFLGMNRQLIQSAEEKFRKKQIRLEHQQEKQYRGFFNPYLSLMTDEDHLLLNHIRHAYENRTHYFHPFDILPELILNNDYFLHFSTLSDLINARSITILRLILFFKLASPQFQTLNADDKVALVKFNIPTLFWLNISLCYNPITNTFCEDEQCDLIFDGKNFIDFYGLDIYNKIIKNLYLLHQFIEIDPMIIYLLILILLFSHFSSCTSLAEPILTDHYYIRQTQNCYIKLLMRILFEKFPEQYANILLSKLILICLNIQNLNRDVCYIESTEILNENTLSLMKVFLMR
jgi:hypothetical protein